MNWEPIIFSVSKATRKESWSGLRSNFRPFFSPPEQTIQWQREGNKRIGRRIKTLEVTPEEMDLAGCWRIAAIERTVIDLKLPKERQIPVVEIAYYTSSCPCAQLNDRQLRAAK